MDFFGGWVGYVLAISEPLEVIGQVFLERQNHLNGVVKEGEGETH